MPANMTEILEVTEDLAGSDEAVAYEFGSACALDLIDSMLYGPNYRRGVWENFVDAVRAFSRGNYDHSDRFIARAYELAGVDYIEH